MTKRHAFASIGLGWAPNLPIHWRTKKLSRIADLSSGEGITAEEIHGAGSFPVFGGNGVRGYSEHFTHEGWFPIIGRQGALCGNINYAKGRFWASEHAVVVTPKEPVNITWLGETLRVMDLNQYSVSAAQPGLSVERINGLKLPLPPLEEQHAIASFLDQETARIDALIAAKEKQKATLGDLDVTIDELAFAQGFSNSLCDSDDSSLWIGQVPDGWNVVRLDLACTRRREDARQDDPLVSVFLDGTATLRSNRPDMIIKSSGKEWGYQHVEAGDILISGMNAHLGGIGVSDSSGKSSPVYLALQASRGVDANFVAGQLRQMAHAGFIKAQIATIRYNSSDFSGSALKKFKLALPSLEDQQKIVEKHAAKRKVIRAARSKLEASIATLKERRQALITQAVTGQLKIPLEAIHA